MLCVADLEKNAKRFGIPSWIAEISFCQLHVCICKKPWALDVLTHHVVILPLASRIQGLKLSLRKENSDRSCA